MHNGILYPQNISNERLRIIKLILEKQNTVLQGYSQIIIQMIEAKESNNEVNYKPLKVFLLRFVIDSFLSKENYLILGNKIEIISPKNKAISDCKHVASSLYILEKGIALL